MKKLLDKIIYMYSKTKILYKMLLLYIIIGIVPVTLLSGYMLYTNTKIIMEQHENQVMAENRRVRNILFNAIYLATSISDTILFDNDLISLLGKYYFNEEEVYKAYREYKTINTLTNTYTEISGIQVYVTNKTLLTSGTFVRIDDEVKSNDWYEIIKDNPGKIVWGYENITRSGSHLFLLRNIPVANTNEYAIVKINISSNFLRFIIDSQDIHSILFIEDEVAFHSNNHTDIGFLPLDLYNVRRVHKKDLFKAVYKDEESLVYTSTLNAPKSSTRFQITTLDSLAYTHIEQSNTFNIRLIAANVVIILMVILIFSFAFNKRIITLRNQMKKIANGELNIISNFKSYDELGELFQDMQKTMKSIQKLNNKFYEEKIRSQELLNYQQQVKFNVLASQINPHFLYNTLETIRMQLTIDDNYLAANMIKQLGKLMRYNMASEGSAVLLTKELEFIKIYMEIQHFRFGERITYEINIDDNIDITDYMILPLLMQPVVENAFIHGLENKKTGGNVGISIYDDNKYLIIEVEDDGLGMSKRKLDELVLRVKDANIKNKAHIGVNNVYQRIKLFYGNSYGIRIKSEVNKYTKITYYLPSIKSNRSMED